MVLGGGQVLSDFSYTRACAGGPRSQSAHGGHSVHSRRVGLHPQHTLFSESLPGHSPPVSRTLQVPAPHALILLHFSAASLSFHAVLSNLSERKYRLYILPASSSSRSAASGSLCFRLRAPTRHQWREGARQARRNQGYHPNVSQCRPAPCGRLPVLPARSSPTPLRRCNY